MKYRAPVAYGLLSFLLLVVGFGLLIRDFQGLIESQRQQNETIALAVADLLPGDPLELSLRSKDAESPEKRLLKEALLQLRLQLGLNGHLHIVQDEGGPMRTVASTEAGRFYGEAFEMPLEADSRLAEGLIYHSSLLERAGSYWIQSYIPLLLSLSSSEGFLIYESQQEAFVFQLLSLGSHYLLIFVGVLLLSLIFLFVLKRKEARLASKASERFEVLFNESLSAYLIVSSEGQIIKANASALRFFDSHLADVEGTALFDGTNRYQLISLEDPSKKPASRFQSSEHFRFKAKLINIADESRYVEMHVEPLKENERLVFIKDISREVLQKKVDGLEELEVDAESTFYDELTGLPNFNYLRSVLDSQGSFRNQEVSSLMIIDLDDFQSVKKDFGVEASQNLLKEFAQFLQRYFRQSDNVIHYTEDKFMVLLPKTDLPNAERIAHTLLQTAKRKNQDRALFSVGVACLEKEESMEDWISRAAAALATAKALGKGRVEIQHSGELELLN